MKKIIHQVTDRFNQRPVLCLFIFAFLLRLTAIIFSKGYGMHDDHFLVIEASQSWVDGYDYNRWLPWNQANPTPQGHSFFYVGIHYLIFSFFKWIGISDPQFKMFLIRLIHGLFSILTVIYGYKIARTISTPRIALRVGLLLASFWFMTWMGVHNLVEFVAVPFLMIGFWWLYKEKTDKPASAYCYPLLSGLITGVAFSVRYQTLIFVGGMGLALLISKRWRDAFIFGAGALISILILQGIPDLIIWKRPYAELTEYIRYNIEHRFEYGTNNYFMYFFVILGFLIPPVSILLFIGFFRSWKKHLLIFLPTFLFILFHTYFPNKQERFCYTVLPFVVFLGLLGWQDYLETGQWKNNRWIKGSLIFFWIVNLIVLGLASVYYSKKARVETMYYMYPHREAVKSILLDQSDAENTIMLPVYYFGKWLPMQTINKLAAEGQNNPEQVRADLIRQYSAFLQDPPQFIIFKDTTNIQTRVAVAKAAFPGLRYATTIQAGTIDRIMNYLTPSNKNPTYYIYSNFK